MIFNGPAQLRILLRDESKIGVNRGSQKEKNKVCVSPKGAPSGRRIRHKRNFANIEDYEARMRKLGYRVVNASELASELDPEEQFALWANTTDIVGIHCSGMMNMMMMPSGGNYTEITGTYEGRIMTNAIIRCSMAAGHRVGVMVCAPDEQGRQEIDLDRLEMLLLDAS